ncbi:MAG: outer membrane protein assembly factor BamE [Magnetospiraceae bacterium]
MFDKKANTCALAPKGDRFRFWGIAAFVAVAVFMMGACTPRIDVRGNAPDEDIIEVIQPGVHGKAEVVGAFGAPSTIGTFRNEAWYYILQRTETTAFLEPEVIERRIIVVLFDDNGIVSDVQEIDQTAGRDIDPVDRVTPTSGHELTIVEQLLGNLGRFNSIPGVSRPSPNGF